MVEMSFDDCLDDCLACALGPSQVALLPLASAGHGVNATFDRLGCCGMILGTGSSFSPETSAARGPNSRRVAIFPDMTLPTSGTESLDTH